MAVRYKEIAGEVRRSRRNAPELALWRQRRQEKEAERRRKVSRMLDDIEYQQFAAGVRDYAAPAFCDIADTEMFYVSPGAGGGRPVLRPLPEREGWGERLRRLIRRLLGAGKDGGNG